ncbi:unnamed protein product [Ixodes persulcatus]
MARGRHWGLPGTSSEVLPGSSSGEGIFPSLLFRRPAERVKKKYLYCDRVYLLIPPPLYRSFPGSADKSDGFRRLRRYPVRTAVKNFFLRFHFEVLPVKTWLVKKGFFEPCSTNCA